MIVPLMTIALILYFASYIIARRRGPYFMTHIPIAIIGFLFDMYATFLMYILPHKHDYGIVLTIHTTLTLIAISLFVVQSYYGIRRYRDKHRLFAEKVYLPMWIVAYMSGFLLFFV